MRRVNETEAVEQLAGLLKTLPPDIVEQVLKLGRAVPGRWQGFSLADTVRCLRRRLDMTQRQLAALAGLPHSKVAKIEGGQDVRLRTLRQLFAGLGCGLVLLPLSSLSAEGLWRRTHALGGEGHIPRRRRYPRR